MDPGLHIVRHRSLAELTTLQVGGVCDWFADVQSVQDLEQAYSWARTREVPVLFMGEGSNVLFCDSGFSGLVLRNRICGIHRDGNEVQVGGGENLCELIRWLNARNLAGMECMYGIPGTLAGAIVGNAGAYGQEICNPIVEVTIWTEGGLRVLRSPELEFQYRHSAFKENRNWFLVSCTLRLQPGRQDLQQVSDEILLKRLVKYPTGLKCPGSFFKNILVSRLPEEVRSVIPADFIMFGKIPAGRLLEEAGAKGARRGGAQVADYHGNLIINCGNASSDDILELADEYAGRVYDRFRIRLEPEILIVEDRTWPHLQVLQAVNWSDVVLRAKGMS